MDAIILAGGYGTRLRPLTYTRPKPLLMVAGRPMIEWVLDRLPPEVTRVIVAVNWKAPALGAYFAKRERKREKRQFIVVKEDEPLGTAGALKNCAQHLRSDAFLVLNADIVSDMDLAALVNLHRVEEGAGAISLKEVPQADVIHFGVISPAPGPGCAEIPSAVRIQGFVEKPKDPAQAPSRLINAGAYVLSRRVLDLIPEGKLVSMEKEIFPQLIPQGFWGLPFDGKWIDVGDPARLRAATRQLDASFTAGADFVLSAEASFANSMAGDRCRIGVNARVVDCVLGDGVTVRSGVVLTDCVVGDGEIVSEDATGKRIWSKPVPEGYPASQVGNAL